MSNTAPNNPIFGRDNTLNEIGLAFAWAFAIGLLTLTTLTGVAGAVWAVYRYKLQRRQEAKASGKEIELRESRDNLVRRGDDRLL